MAQFGIGRAWSLGLDFIRRAPSGHAVLLILMPALAPATVQYALIGGASSMMNPQSAIFGAGALGGGGAATAAAVLITYVLSTSGYFGSWRLGLERGALLGGAVRYGLMAGVAVVVLGIVIGIGAVVLGLGLGWVGGLLAMLLVLPLFTALYAAMVGTMGIAMIAMGLLLLLFGAVIGAAAPAMGGFGAGAVGAGVMIALGLVFLWIAARLSCVTPVLAHKGDLNFVAAFGASWRLTGPAQGRIMLYLALVGLLFGLLYLILAGAIAVSAGGPIASGGAPRTGLGTFVFTVVMSILTAYVSVLVPAGIYRALQPDIDASAAVFE